MLRTTCVLLALFVSATTADMALTLSRIKERIACDNIGLAPLDCSQCMDKLLQLNVANNEVTLRKNEATILLQLANLKEFCIICYSDTDCLQKHNLAFKANNNLLGDNLKYILNDVKIVYKPVYDTECFSAETILREITAKNINDTGFNESEEIARTVMKKLLSGKCIQDEEYNQNLKKQHRSIDEAKLQDEKQKVKIQVLHTDPVVEPLTSSQVALYSFIAVLIVSSCSLIGVTILPFLARYAYFYIMMGFIGLSFGTMAGDALLHILPQVLGVHTHEHEHDHDHDSDHDHDHDELVHPYLWKLLGIVVTIYGFFFFSAISVVFDDHHDGTNSHGHGHSHMPQPPIKSTSVKTESTGQSDSNLVEVERSSDENDDESEEKAALKAKPIIFGMSRLALIIIVGGAIHNIADGLAIAASFSSGAKSGISTSLAIFFHELPHEFGDFVVLISTGLTVKRALILNFISALFAFCGMGIGLAFGKSTEAQTWIMSITVGFFIYAAFVEMLPELAKFRGKSPKKMFIIKNLGVLLGFAIMMLIAIFEDKIPI